MNSCLWESQTGHLSFSRPSVKSSTECRSHFLTSRWFRWSRKIKRLGQGRELSSLKRMEVFLQQWLKIPSLLMIWAQVSLCFFISQLTMPSICFCHLFLQRRTKKSSKHTSIQIKMYIINKFVFYFISNWIFFIKYYFLINLKIFSEHFSNVS